MRARSAVISFLGNGQHDSRVTNLYNSLKAEGLEVKVISFDWLTPNFKSIKGDFAVFKLSKSKFSILFYLHFLLKLSIELFKTKADIYFAEDIFNLPIASVIGKLKGGKVYYNSRELYPFLGGLRNKKKLQSLFAKIEKMFIYKIDLLLTTGPMDSKFLEDYYKLERSIVIRNIPLYKEPERIHDFRSELNIPEDHLILLYQGVILEGRGIEVVLKAITNIDRVELILLGDGPLQEKYQRLAKELGLTERVHFYGTIKQKELINYTAGGDIGIALIENISKSYYFALPNKLFEYIMAGLPVLSCKLPQMKKIIEDHSVGETVDPEKVEKVVEVIKKWQSNNALLKEYKRNCNTAAKVLNWQKEFENVKNDLIAR